MYEAGDATSTKWTGTAVDLVFGSPLSAGGVSKVYGGDDSKEKSALLCGCVGQVMNLDRFELASIDGARPVSRPGHHRRP